MNPFRRFLDFISYPSHSRTIGFLAFLVVLLAVPLTVNVAQKQQELRQHAANFTEGGGGGSNLKPLCTGTCTGVQTCQNPDANGTGVAGTVDTSMRCDSPGTACCIIGAGTSGTSGTSGTTNTCTGSCLWPNLQGCEVAEGAGHCSVIPGKTCGNSNACIQVSSGGGPGNGTTSCHTDATSAVGCTVGCAIVNGKNQKCHLQNRDASGQCSASCTTGGPWNCVEDASCPNTGSGGTGGTVGTTCDANCTFANGKLCQNNQCSDIPNTITCSTTPICASGTLYNFPNNKFGCLASTNNWTSPTCGSGPSTGTVGTGTQVAFVIGLDGIGKTGDRQNPTGWQPTQKGQGSNQNPVNKKSRHLTYQVFTSEGTTPPSAEGESTVSYDSANGKFTTGVTLKTTLTDGSYIIKVKVDGFLARIIRGVAVSGGVAQANIDLANGDTNRNNQLDILDYNLIHDCAFKAFTPTCAPADLDDNGAVDQYDYNLFIREYASPALQATRENGD